MNKKNIIPGQMMAVVTTGNGSFDKLEYKKVKTPNLNNNEVLVNDQINQSLLLEARGRGERLKGDLTARAEYMKAVGTMAGNYSSSGSILSS